MYKICIFRALFESVQRAADGVAVKRVSLMFCITTIDYVMLALQASGTCSLHVEERMPVELERRRSRSQNLTCLAAAEAQIANAAAFEPLRCFGQLLLDRTRGEQKETLISGFSDLHRQASKNESAVVLYVDCLHVIACNKLVCSYI